MLTGLQLIMYGFMPYARCVMIGWLHTPIYPHLVTECNEPGNSNSFHREGLLIVVVLLGFDLFITKSESIIIMEVWILNGWFDFNDSQV